MRYYSWYHPTYSLYKNTYTKIYRFYLSIIAENIQTNVNSYQVYTLKAVKISTDFCVWSSETYHYNGKRRIHCYHMRSACRVQEGSWVQTSCLFSFSLMHKHEILLLKHEFEPMLKHIGNTRNWVYRHPWCVCN